MKNRSTAIALSIALLVATGVFTFFRMNKPEPPVSESAFSPEPVDTLSNEDVDPDVTRRLRLNELRQLRRDASDEELRTFIESSDSATKMIREEGYERSSSYLQSRMDSYEIRQEEIVRYYEENREIFGKRTVEESTHNIDRILRIQRIKDKISEH
jgi:hypothetical protein